MLTTTFISLGVKLFSVILCIYMYVLAPKYATDKTSLVVQVVITGDQFSGCWKMVQMFSQLAFCSTSYCAEQTCHPIIDCMLRDYSSNICLSYFIWWKWGLQLGQHSANINVIICNYIIEPLRKYYLPQDLPASKCFLFKPHFNHDVHWP